MDYKFELASEKDDFELRQLLARNPVPGSISLIYKREPSFYLSIGLMGKKSDIIVCRFNEKIIGMGICSLIDCYVNGEEKEIGYLHSLRLDKEYRSRYGILVRGFKFFKELYQRNNVPFFLTTVIEENEYAVKILTSRRLSIPSYIDIGRHTTFAVNFKKKMKAADEYEVKRTETSQDIEQVIQFLNDEGRKKQFYPIYSKEDLLRFSEFGFTDMYVAYRNDEIVGTLSKWDQTEIKQTIVKSYSHKWVFIKSLNNLVSSFTGCKKLPATGEEFFYFFISFVAIKDNDKAVFYALMRSIYNDNINQNYNYCILGFHSNDPLAEVMRYFSTIKYNARMYIAGYRPIDEKILNSKLVPFMEASRM